MALPTGMKGLTSRCGDDVVLRDVARLFQESEYFRCSLVKDFGRLFSVVAGQPHRIDEHRSPKSADDKTAAHRYRARQKARELFSTA